MLERDIEPFHAMLNDVWGFYPAAKAPTAGQETMFFRALSEHTIAAVRSGFDQHMRDPQRGKFAPLPSDIIAQIEGSAAKDMRPGPEEAWAIALQASDENKTIVWTDEMSQAWGTAHSVFQQGDEVGARMAFKETYARLVAESRRVGRPANWSASLGHDAEQRDVALERAHVAGFLPKPEPLKALAAPAHALSWKNKGMPDHIKADLERMAEAMAGGTARADWARELEQREKAGDSLTDAQRVAWRKALEVVPADQTIGDFKPIPVDMFPPAMRNTMENRE